MTLKQVFAKPAFASLLAEPRTAAWVCAAAALHVGLTLAGLPGWQCPWLAVTGRPCPGCGLTRATVALLRGEWRTALTLHAFAPILLAFLALLASACLLPAMARARLVERIARLERRAGLTVILLLIFLLYWLIRLFVFPASLAALTQSQR